MLELWNTSRIAAVIGCSSAGIREYDGARNAAGIPFPGPVAAIGEHLGWLPEQAQNISGWLADQHCPDPPALVVYLSTSDVASLLGMAVKTVQMAVWRRRNTDRPDPIPEPDVRIIRRNGRTEAEGWLPGRRGELRRWRNTAPVLDDAPVRVVEVVGLAHLARTLRVQPRTVREWYDLFTGAFRDPFPRPDVITAGCENVTKTQPGWRPERVAAIAAWHARHRARCRAASAVSPGEPDPVVGWVDEGKSWRAVAALAGLSVQGARLRYHRARSAGTEGN